MRAVADRLDAAGLRYAFVGGSVVNLLLDHPDLSPARPTDDVDVIVEAVADRRYSDLEALMREKGFSHDMSQGAPRCRWKLGAITVDIMPTAGESMGLNTAWFAEALATANEKTVRGDVTLRLVSPAGFVATKLVAFFDRGREDFHGSRDIEDLLTVIDGRANIVAEINQAPAELREFVAESLASLLDRDDFLESLSGALASDDASQARLPFLRRKLAEIAKLVL